MAGILSNAISGLQASQIALRTTGNNISNASTAGYSRQDVNFSTRIEQRYGEAGFIGNGVSTDSVTRVVNEFISTQLRLDTSAFNQLDKLNSNMAKVDKLFSDSSTGLMGGLQEFFAAVQNGANDPASTPARQLVVTQTQSLSARFNNLYDRLAETEKGVNTELSQVTEQVSALASAVGKLNLAIAEKNASGNGAQPNDLLDQRDETLRKLAELSSVQIVRQDGGTVNVFIGKGEPLVVGAQVSKFQVKDGSKIVLSNDVISADVTDEITGGKLGGLLQFRKDVLEPSFNDLGRVAIVMADAFNKIQGQGLDLNGNYGAPMFADINQQNLMNERVKYGNNAVPNDRSLSVKIDDPAKLTTSDYKIEIIPNTTNYVITREKDDTVIEQGILSGVYPETVKFDGLAVTFNSGSFQGGDTFTLQPTRTGSRDFKSEIQVPALLAFAVPVRTSTSIGNTGKGTVSSGEVLSLVDANNNVLPAFATAGKMSPPVIVRFTSDTTYEVLDNTDPGHPVPLTPAMREQIFIPNRDNAVFTTDKGETRIIGNGARIGLPAGRSASSPVYPATAAQTNGYPAEQYTFSTQDPVTGIISTQVMNTVGNASAAVTAQQISNIAGVSAHAFTTATITDINIAPAAFTYPLQLSVNGENLLQYVGGIMDSDVPDPNVSEGDFNNYLASQINSNANLQSLGIRAQSSSNPVTGVPELKLVASSGVNLDIRFTAPNSSVNNISVNDGSGNPNVRLNGVDDGLPGGDEQSAVTVGGKIDITLANGITLSTAPNVSQLLGDSTSPTFATNAYTGFQMVISGQPKAGDQFTLDFNKNSKNDNRNALAFANLESASTITEGNLSFGQAYGQLVEEVGTKSNLAQVNSDASKSLLEQTKTLRDGVSGVNLDEEAASLIQFQQLYQANARVISVAKDLFDTLVRSLG